MAIHEAVPQSCHQQSRVAPFRTSACSSTLAEAHVSCALVGRSIAKRRSDLKRKPKQPKGSPRASRSKTALALLGVGLAVGLFWVIRRPATPPTTPRTEASANPSDGLLPYYESEEAAKPFPATLPPAYFRNVHVARAYRVAQQLPGVLAQQPCYCYCYSSGHQSLLDCYRSDHGAGCLICIKEVLLAEKFHHQGKSTAEIRAAVVRGEWRHLELE